MKGRIDHRDSLGNKGTIHGGESQWMTGGSGILHEEMPLPTEHMLGLQLWINLPSADKMTDTKYFDITADTIREAVENGSHTRVIAGKYKELRGAQGHHLPATILDITVEPGKTFSMESNPEWTLFVYIVEGSGSFGSDTTLIPNKRALLFAPGDEFSMEAGNEGMRFILATAPPLGEPVAWGGPIVMNTREELRHAFEELENGTFIKHKPAGKP